MATLKDYLRLVVTSLITVLITMTISSAVATRNKTFESATIEDIILLKEKDIPKAINESKSYTDIKIQEHEKNQALQIKAIENDMQDVKRMVRFLYERELNKVK